MKTASPFKGLLLGLVLGLPLAALFYLGWQFRLIPFIPFEIFDWNSRVLPGSLITTSIDIIVRIIRAFNLGATAHTAKAIEHLLAYVFYFALTAVTGLVLALLPERRGKAVFQRGLAAGIVLFLILCFIEASLRRLTFVSGLLLAAAFIAWGIILNLLISRGKINLLKLSGSVAASTAALFIAASLSSTVMPSKMGAGIPLDRVRPDTQALALIAGTIPVARRTGTPPAPGTRPEVTSNEAFYRIDIDSLPPMIDTNSWKIEIAGLFGSSRAITYQELMKFPEVTQPITLGCISNPVGGDLISTGFFTGVRLSDILKDRGITPGAKALKMSSIDGYYENVSYEDMFDPQTLVVYGMNGKTLSFAQGFPVRLYLPNRYGMKQPKWITRIEAVSAPVTGYWEDRGWSMEAIVQTLSMIDTIAKNAKQDGKIPVGGIAWAGGRGIKRVEVQVDNGAWQEAKLLQPVLGPLTWVLWRYDWPEQSGRHTFRVRAVDGKGAVQPAGINPPHPAGATGYDEKSEFF
jgi:DMSO/TMAO reductase YedYZ molybdopterin-dependent catalytic subunit